MHFRFLLLNLHKENLSRNVEFSFFRDSNGNEIDLVVSTGAATTLVEIKQTATPRAEHFQRLKSLMPLFGKSTGLVACLTDAEEPYATSLSALSWHQVAARTV